MKDNFRINDQGRPEGTSLRGEAVVHYTCNAPAKEVLEKFGIKPVGEEYGVEPREVLIIPKDLFDRYGRRIGTAEAENLLANLGRK